MYTQKLRQFKIVQSQRKTIAESQAASKQVMKRRNPEACAITRAKRAKEERDQGRDETLASLEVHNHNEIKSSHEEKMTALLLEYEPHD